MHGVERDATSREMHILFSGCVSQLKRRGCSGLQSSGFYGFRVSNLVFKSRVSGIEVRVYRGWEGAGIGFQVW